MKDTERTQVERTQIEADKTQVEHSKTEGHKTAIKTFREYTIVKELPATGGEADAFVIKKENTEYFLKLYRKGINPKIEVLEKIKKLSERFSEHVVRIYEVGFDRELERYYEIMEYAKYGNLREAYSQYKIKLEDIIKELAEAIHMLHQSNIIHRDIKPINILVRDIKPLDLVLTDFGISSAVMEDVSKVLTTIKGTFQYSAPETFSGYFGKEVDWWSLGMLVYEFLTGSNPFKGLSQQVIMHKLITENVPIPKGIDKKYELLLKGLLTKNPKKRWGYEQVRRWLEGDLSIKTFYEEEERKDEEELKEWQKLGFTPQGAKVWKEAGLKPREADGFRKKGFTPNEAAEWVKVGIRDANTAKKWKSLGISPERAEALDRAGLGPAKVSEFLKKGLSIEKLTALIKEASASAEEVEKFWNTHGATLRDLSVKQFLNAFDWWRSGGLRWNDLDWIRHNFSFNEAVEWKKVEFSLSEATVWKNAGFNPKEAKEWREVRFSLSEAREWKELGFNPNEAKEWKDAGFNLSEAVAWKKAGFNLSEAGVWKKAGFNLSETIEWKKAGFNPKEAKEWREVRFSLSEAKGWKELGFNPNEAKEWKDAVFNLSEAIEWKKTGFNLNEAMVWKKLGFDLSEAIEWKEVGFGSHEAGGWKKAGFRLSEAVEWKNVGLSFSVVELLSLIQLVGYASVIYFLFNKQWAIALSIFVGVLSFWYIIYFLRKVTLHTLEKIDNNVFKYLFLFVFTVSTIIVSLLIYKYANILINIILY